MSKTLFSSRIFLYKKKIVIAHKKKLVQFGQDFFLAAQAFCTQKKTCTRSGQVFFPVQKTSAE